MLAAARRDAASHSSTGRRWHHLWRLLLFQKCLLGCDALLNECSAEEHVEKKKRKSTLQCVRKCSCTKKLLVCLGWMRLLFFGPSA